jgi:hypothetical protein
MLSFPFACSDINKLCDEYRQLCNGTADTDEVLTGFTIAAKLSEHPTKKELTNVSRGMLQDAKNHPSDISGRGFEANKANVVAVIIVTDSLCFEIEKGFVKNLYKKAFSGTITKEFLAECKHMYHDALTIAIKYTPWTIRQMKNNGWNYSEFVIMKLPYTWEKGEFLGIENVSCINVKEEDVQVVYVPNNNVNLIFQNLHKMLAFTEEITQPFHYWKASNE